MPLSTPSPAPTSLACEQTEQARWHLRPHCSWPPWFDRLLANEFLTPRQQHDVQCHTLEKMIRHASRQVPYYEKLFATFGLTASDIQNPEDLSRLPILTKIKLRHNAAELTARALPDGQYPGKSTQSSGTTGQPVRVQQTRYSMGMFSLLKQRELRWFRFDPCGTLAIIRLPSQIPLTQQRQLLPSGHTLHLSTWPLVGRFFQTGPAHCFSVLNQVDQQAEWLDRNRPDYILSYPETFEHLCFAFQSRPRPDYPQGLLAISEQLTTSMRQRIGTTFVAPLNQNYGLNEVGIVASRCREAGRYHVHTEHCLVEILAKDGSPCRPGETGRIMVTTLSNLAMPLIRYDTGDLAEAVDGPCPCGRTLPSFGEVKGRYSRIAFLPENTLGQVAVIRQALEDMPPELTVNLRQFQIHQFRDQSFELRLGAPGGLPPEFEARLISAWQMKVVTVGKPLVLMILKTIPRGAGGKFQDFTSDFFPVADNDK